MTITINVFPRVGTIKRPLITATMKREWTREDLMDAVGINGHYGGSRHVFRGTNQRHVLIGSSKRNRHAHPPHSTVTNTAKTHPSLFTFRSSLFFFNSLSICFFQSFYWWYQIDSGIQWIPLTPSSPPLFPLSETLNPNTTWRELSSKRTDLHKFVTGMSSQPAKYIIKTKPNKIKQPLPNKPYRTQTWKTRKSCYKSITSLLNAF